MGYRYEVKTANDKRLVEVSEPDLAEALKAAVQDGLLIEGAPEFRLLSPEEDDEE